MSYLFSLRRSSCVLITCSIRETYCLPEDANQWSSVFAARVVSNNKEYRLRVKQDMQTAAHNLKHLYSEGGDGDDSKTSNAMQILVAMVVGALKANRRMNCLLDEVRPILTYYPDAAIKPLF